MRKKIAVITGGSSGIGLTTAKALSQEGHMVVIGSRRCNTGESSPIKTFLG